MNSKTFFIFLFLLFFLVAPVMAQDITFQFNKEFDFKRTCLNNGTFCSGVATCNMTIIYPDSNILVDNVLMTNQGSFHNVTVFQPDNSQLGIHPYIMSCSDGGTHGGKTGNILITGDGKDFQEFPTQFVIAIFSIIFICIGLFSEKFRMFKHLGSIMILLFGVVTLYPGYSFINWSTLLGKGLGFSAIGLGFYFFIEESFSRDEQEERYGQGSKKFVEEVDDGRFHG